MVRRCGPSKAKEQQAERPRYTSGPKVASNRILTVAALRARQVLTYALRFLHK